MCVCVCVCESMFWGAGVFCLGASLYAAMSQLNSDLIELSSRTELGHILFGWCPVDYRQMPRL